VHALRDWLAAEGIRPKPSGRARQCGAVEFGRGALFHLLKNRVYLGEITHKGASYPGRHPAILDVEIFEAAQLRLNGQAERHKQRPLRCVALLKGRVFDAAGRPMSPVFSQGKAGQLYRYYVSTDLQQGRRRNDDDGDPRRVSAPALENLVHGLIRRLSGRSELAWPDAASLVRRVEVYAETLQVSVQADPGAGLAPSSLRSRRKACENLELVEDVAILTLPIRAQVRSGRTWLLWPDGHAPVAGVAVNRSLVRALKAAHAVMREVGILPEAKPEQLLAAASPASAYDRKLCMLGYLAPDIQRAILEGRQPRTLTFEQLTREDLPLSWTDQRRVLGF
jgi:hypothetical protein